jgi:hypothetical protein
VKRLHSHIAKKIHRRGLELQVGETNAKFGPHVNDVLVLRQMYKNIKSLLYVQYKTKEYGIADIFGGFSATEQIPSRYAAMQRRNES